MARDDSTPFARLLQEFRLAAGLTQEALAEASGLSVRGIQELERGHHQPYRDTVERLGRGLALQGEGLDRLQLAARPKPRHPGNGPRVPLHDAGEGETTVPAHGLASDAVPPRPPPHNLPIELTSFVGRESEISRARELLRTTRLLTLTGSGGCGKTRLALRVAAEVVGEFPDGVWLVELASHSDPRLVGQTIASTLGIRERPGQPLLETLQAELRGRRLLLLLDNCEHLIDACAQLVEGLLVACDHLQVLATSRERLSISGEVAWRVPSLSFPDPGRLPSVARLTGYGAVRLFAERALLVRPAFTVTEQNAAAVARICWRLDGIPLAIELAAAGLRGLAVEQIAARLDGRFSLLASGRRTALPRQQTLRAMIDWSYDLLSAEEKVLLHRLAVFVGGWSLESAETVCAGGSIEASDVLDLLLRLVDKSLVLAETAHEPVRYRLLETVRQYALEHLKRSGEGPSVKDRHLDWCLALAERGAPELSGREQSDWLKRFELEHDNLREALAWALSRESNPDAAFRLGTALGRFWQGALHPTEAREWLGRLIATSGWEPKARIRVLWLASEAEAHLGNHRKALAWRQESLGLARETGEERLIALALQQISFFSSDLGDMTEARRLQEAALVLARGSGDQRAILEVLSHLSGTLARLGDPGSLRPVAEEGLALSRAFGDEFAVALFLSHLGHASLAEGDASRARGLDEASLSQAREAGSVLVETLALRLLGDVARSEGDLDGAKVPYREMFEAWRRGTENRLYTTGLLASVAGLALARGQTRLGLRLLGAVHEWLGTIGMPVPWMPGPFYQNDDSAARQALGEAAFARAWAEGQAMTLEEAVEDALRELDEKPPGAGGRGRAVSSTCSAARSGRQVRRSPEMPRRLARQAGRGASRPRPLSPRDRRRAVSECLDGRTVHRQHLGDDRCARSYRGCTLRESPRAIRGRGTPGAHRG